MARSRTEFINRLIGIAIRLVFLLSNLMVLTLLLLLLLLLMVEGISSLAIPSLSSIPCSGKLSILLSLLLPDDVAIFHHKNRTYNNIDTSCIEIYTCDATIDIRNIINNINISDTNYGDIVVVILIPQSLATIIAADDDNYIPSHLSQNNVLVSLSLDVHYLRDIIVDNVDKIDYLCHLISNESICLKTNHDNECYNVNHIDLSDFKQWPLFSFIRLIHYIVNHFVGHDKLNGWINYYTHGTGTFMMDFGTVTIELSGLNSFDKVILLTPTIVPSHHWSSFEFNNSLMFAAKMPFIVTISSTACSVRNEALIEYKDTPSNWKSMLVNMFALLPEGTSIQLRIKSVKVLLNLFVTLSHKDVHSFLSVSREKLKPKSLGCWLRMIHRLDFTRFLVSVDDVDVVVVGEKAPIQANFTELVNELLQLITNPSAVHNVNIYLSKLLMLSPKLCSGASTWPTYSKIEPSETNNSQLINYVFLAVCSAAVTVLLITIANNFRRKVHRRMDRRTSSKNRYLPAIKFNETTQIQQQWHYGSLVSQARCHSTVKVCMVVGILANIATFVYSNISKDAVVIKLTVYLSNQEILKVPVYQFGLVHTLSEMWNAKVYVLAILIAFFSGAWPYIKLAVMLVCWVMPVSLISTTLRGSLLKLVDAYGKWSLIDFFVMVLMMCAFSITVPLGALQIVVNVRPNWGFYSFLFATIASLVIGHIMVILHEDAVHRRTICQREINSGALVDHKFKFSSEILLLWPLSQCLPLPSPLTISVTFSVSFRRIVRVLLFPSHVGLLVASIIIPTFWFEFHGLLGSLLFESSRRTLSSVMIGESIPVAFGSDHDVHIIIMSAFYFLFTLVLPIILLVMLWLLWVLPMTTLERRRLLRWTEIIDAWTSLEVLLVSLIAASVEIGQFASFIVGDKCNAINAFMRVAKDIFAVPHNDPICFRVNAGVLPACATLIIMAVLTRIMCRVSMNLTRCCISDQEYVFIEISKQQTPQGIHSSSTSEMSHEGESINKSCVDEENVVRHCADSELFSPLLLSQHQAPILPIDHHLGPIDGSDLQSFATTINTNYESLQNSMGTVAPSDNITAIANPLDICKACNRILLRLCMITGLVIVTINPQLSSASSRLASSSSSSSSSTSHRQHHMT